MTCKIDLELLKDQMSPEHHELVSGIIARQGKNKGLLRASKPKIEYNPGIGRYGQRIRVPEYKTGCTAYIWRMVSFYVGTHPEMPVTAEFDLPVSSVSEEGKALIEELESVVDIVVKSIPPSELRGMYRWGKALGMI